MGHAPQHAWDKMQYKGDGKKAMKCVKLTTERLLNMPHQCWEARLEQV